VRKLSSKKEEASTSTEVEKRKQAVPVETASLYQQELW
jgi:hypothetical protein